MTAAQPIPIAVLISGRGSNLAALIEATRSQAYPARIVRVISDRPDAAGLAFAEEAEIRTEVVRADRAKHPLEFDVALHEAMLRSGAHLICMAGFMRILSADLIRRWPNKLLNIHPSLLPSFRGLRPHRQALQAGVKLHGATVHIVTPQVDSGPILAQAAVPVLADDTETSLAARVLEAEHKLYPSTVADFLARRDRAALQAPLYNPPVPVN